MDQVLQALSGLEERIVERVGRRLDERIDGLRREMNGHFDAIYKRLEKLDVEYDLVVVALRGLEKRMDGMEVRLDKVDMRLDNIERRLDNIEREVLKADLANLRARVTDLTGRIAQIEARLDSTKPS